MRELILMRFEYPTTDLFYQEVENGQITRRWTVDGQPLVLPEPCGYGCESATPDKPAWYAALVTAESGGG